TRNAAATTGFAQSGVNRTRPSRLGSTTRLRASVSRLLRVVQDLNSGRNADEADEIAKPSGVPFVDSRIRNVVTSGSDPRLHPLDVQLGRCEPDVPDTHIEACLCRPVEFAADAAPAERGLEGEVLALIDRVAEMLVPIVQLRPCPPSSDLTFYPGVAKT